MNWVGSLVTWLGGFWLLWEIENDQVRKVHAEY